MTEPWEGLLLIDKPAGPTSHDIVARVRAALGGARVGHTGTLDPPATGLLLLVLGRATRLARFLPSDPKVYEGVFELGVTTDTDDLSGEVRRRHGGLPPHADEVRTAAARLEGRHMQVPPAVSAKRVAGTRLYRLARRGRPAEAAPVEVLISSVRVAPTLDPALWTYELVVSTGTYVRAAVRDLGEMLGCGAAVSTLRRTAIGPLSVAEAMPWPEDRAALKDAVATALRPIDRLPLALPGLILPDEPAGARFAGGAAVRWTEPVPSGLVAVRGASGGLLGIGAVEDGHLLPKVVLPAS